MNYTSEKNTTKTEKSLLEQLTEKNKSGLAEMRSSQMPVMIPVQEKDWDTMVSLLQAAVDFQPRVYELMETLLTKDYMNEMLDDWLDVDKNNFDNATNAMNEKFETRQTKAENILHRMEALEQQAGKNLEKI